MTHGDDVRDYLEVRGCDPETVQGGVPALVEQWERLSNEVAGGEYALGLDDYLSDLDIRDILQGALEANPGASDASLRARIEMADRRFQSATTASPRCLWGDALAEDHGWRPEAQWWYYRYPRDHHSEFGEDLRATGIEA